jgi:predicted PurR-regulated permease PerM
MDNTEKILDVSWRTILKVAITIIVFYILFSIRQILVWFVFSLTLSILFNPAVNFLQKKRIPRSVAVIIIYVGVFGLLGILIYMMIPIFTSEIQRFLELFPTYFERISPPFRSLGIEAFDSIETFLKTIEGTLGGMAKNIFSALFVLFGGVFTTLFVIVTAIFLSLEGDAVERALVLLFPKRYEVRVLSVWKRCQKKVAGWFAGRIVACLFVGVASYIAFFIFTVKYPFTLALFAGVFNFVPYVGPLLTGILLFLIIFPTSPAAGILVIIVFVLIQQIENSILSPILMKKFVGLPPVLVLLSLVIGGDLWGVLGAILAVPLFGIVFEFLKEFLEKRRDRQAIAVQT